MSNRGRGWKRSRWGSKMGGGGGFGRRGRWRTNYRGHLRGLGSWSGSWGERSTWRTNYRGWLGRGDGGRRSVWEGAGECFGRADYGGGPLRTSMHGSMDPSVGLTSALSEHGHIPRQNGTGGILSSFQPNFGGGKSRLKKVSIATLTPEVRERYEAQVSALILRYGRVFYHATGDDVQPVVNNLRDLLGPKYARLTLDWVHQRGRAPDVDEVARFVVWVVEAAAVDGGREPLSWKIQRAITGLVERLLGGRVGQAKEIQSAPQVGAVSAGP